MPKFDTKQSDLTIEVRFAAPAFALMTADSWGLNDEIYGVLGKYGLTANDITQDNASSAIGARSITYTANPIATAVKLQISRVEIACWDLKRLSKSDGTAIFAGVMEALLHSLPTLEFEGYYTTLSVHASISDQTAAQFINARIGKELQGLGPSTGHALAYYFGDSGPRRRLVIVLDGSALYADALYLRQNADYDGKMINHKDVPGALDATLSDTMKALDLEAAK